MKNLTLKNYKSKKCYNRTKKQNAIVDAHFHMRPFGGPPIEFRKMIRILKKEGVLFAELYGIGQKLPTNKPCTYYKNCPGTSVTPTMVNDIMNAQLLLDNQIFEINGIKINLSMTFPDLEKPDDIVKGIKYLDKEYPKLFNWMGEVNLVKQAIFKNGHRPVPINIISKWAPFMKILRERKFPLSLHSDLGNNKDKFKYLPLIKEVLHLYPNNIVVWLHLGLCKELSEIDSETHTKMLDELIKKYKNLYFDISWRVLYDQQFSDPKKRIFYVELMNKHPKRFLTGTDFVASVVKNEKIYKEEHRVTSLILSELNNEAFRCIALGQNYLDLIHSKYKAPNICLK